MSIKGKNTEIKIFHCYVCGGIFKEEKNWTEEDRKKEYDQNFGDKYRDEESVLACDSCYQEALKIIKEDL